MPAQIPELAKQNFPLCMKSMQEVIVIIDGADLVKLGLPYFWNLVHVKYISHIKTSLQVLATTHHIKYKSRLQYGLFLKGIGLTLEDALKFFRGEFTKKADTDIDKFEKEYAYGIR